MIVQINLDPWNSFGVPLQEYLNPGKPKSVIVVFVHHKEPISDKWQKNKA